MRSGTRCDVLVDGLVEIGDQAVSIERGGASEHVDDLVARGEATPADRDQLAHWHAASRDDEGLAMVELAHDFTTLVAQLSLGDRPGH